MAAKRLILTPPERRELQRRVRSRSVRAEDSRRARVILELAGGRGLRETASDLSCSTSYVQRWAGRFRAERLGGLVASTGRAAAKGAAKLEARILEWTRRGPDDGSTQWSSRRLAQKLGTTHMSVARVWSRYGLQPHRLRAAADDPSSASPPSSGFPPTRFALGGIGLSATGAERRPLRRSRKAAA